MKENLIGEFVRRRRKEAGLTQIQLAAKAGVGLRFIRDLEQGKQSLRTDTINKVLALFGKCVGPVDMPRE
jgi:y4mF family transcriptional regulator